MCMNVELSYLKMNASEEILYIFACILWKNMGKKVRKGRRRVTERVRGASGGSKNGG